MPLDVYETFSFWSLTTNFPSLDEQAALLGSSPQQPGANNKSAAHTGQSIQPLQSPEIFLWKAKIQSPNTMPTRA